MCAGHFTGILLGLLYIRWRGYILCVQVILQAYCWVCCLSDEEGIFCVGRHDREGIFRVCRHSAGFAVYLTERVYFVCAGILVG